MDPDRFAMDAAGRRDALAHLAGSLVLCAATFALSPAKFERAAPLSALLAVVLLLGGAGCARAAWSARARHGVAVPGWSPLDRGWWGWDPPLRAFHWSLCAHALLLTWALVLAAVAFEAATGHKLPVALDAVAAGAGQALTGFGAAVLVAGGGTLLARRWALRAT
jgi:hypothetical protein